MEPTEDRTAFFPNMFKQYLKMGSQGELKGRKDKRKGGRRIGPDLNLTAKQVLLCTSSPLPLKP